jgi:RimJ/RimL family protein N-acetyltransferase
MVRLVPMTEEEFAAYLKTSIPDYANEHVESGQWRSEEALALSQEEHRKLLPEGLRTPDHYLFTLRADKSDARVGELWYGIRREGLVTAVWIYWIGIHEAFRRHGHATAALRAAEIAAPALGADRVQLHVFGKNAPARATYTRAGFIESNVIMTKRVGPPAAAGGGST